MKNSAPLPDFMKAWWKSREALYASTISIGLLIDQIGVSWIFPGEYIVNLVVWSIFFSLFKSAQKKERIEMVTVLLFATPMELFFSEVWHLYEYREGMMPLFVPAGHWFLFDLGRRIASHFSKIQAWILILPVLFITVVLAITGVDQTGIVFIWLVIGFMYFGPQATLYSVMVWLALIMELWGTFLGNWAWASEESITGLVMMNPPLLCGVFYALGDLLVGLAVRQVTDEEP